MLPINHLTWSEVVRRLLLAYLLMRAELDFKEIDLHTKTKLIRCLQGDAGIFIGSPSSAVGADSDAKILGRAVDNIFGNLTREKNTMSMGSNGTTSDHLDGSIPGWAKGLDTVLKLPTNVGSRIRHCVLQALEKHPPEWAKEKLEASISKGVYNGNACGSTKKEVKEILNTVASDLKERVSPPETEVTRRRSELTSKVIMKQCQTILRNVVAPDTEMGMLYLLGMNFTLDNDVMTISGNVPARPLNLRTINFRISHGAYGGSHEAFLEDVRELWANIKKSKADDPNLVMLADEKCTEFEKKVEKKLEDLSTGIEDPVAPLETDICKLCGINGDDKNLLLCDAKMCNGETCNAAYHIYCLSPPLSEVPKDNWYCPTCVPPKDPQQSLQYVDNSWEEANQILDILIALEEREYCDLEADKKLLILNFLCEESLNLALVNEYLESSKVKLTKVLGTDSVRRLYWGFPCTSLQRGIVVNQNASVKNIQTSPHDHHADHVQSENSSTWSLFQSDEDVSNLVNYLTRNDPARKQLKNSILKWQKATLKGSVLAGMNLEKRHMVFSTTLYKSPSTLLATKATALLEAKCELHMEQGADKSLENIRKRNMAKWHRCECLEHVLPGRYHCLKCHETFFTNFAVLNHKNHICITTYEEFTSVSRYHGACSIGPDRAHAADIAGFDCLSQIGSNNLSRKSEQFIEVGRDFAVPEASLKPLVGKARHTLKQLKINLLDMEAALPDGAKRSSRACPKWRSAWCAFVKSSNTIDEMVQATLVLETMIKTEYINNIWWWHWSSASAAAKISTMSAIAFRIYMLDAAINYKKISQHFPPKETNEKNENSKEAKKQINKAKEQEKLNKIDMA